MRLKTEGNALKVPWKRTYRSRLVMTITICVALALAALFALAFLLFQSVEMSDLQENLLGCLRQAQEETEKRPTRPELFEVTELYPTVNVAVYRADGSLVGASGRPVPHVTPVGDVQWLGNTEFGVRTMPCRDLTLVVATDLSPIRSTQRKFGLFLAGLWVFIVAACALLVNVASRATFRPLEAMTELAGQLGPDERLPTNNAGEYAAFANSLNGHLDRVEEAIRGQERFLADAAHELRTPLAILRARLENASKTNSDEGSALATLQEMHHEVARLSAVVEALLISAVPTEDLVPALNLDQAVERAHSRWADRFAERSVTLDLDIEPVRAAFGPGEFDAVIDNLLSNALRASPEGSTCQLLLRQVGAWAELVVKDEGPGVAADLRDRVFDRFVRGSVQPDSAGRPTGFGVGLYVCRRLLQSRGGEIDLMDSRGGAHFRARFPTL